MIKTLKEYLDFGEAKGWILHIKEKVLREDIPEIIHRLSERPKVLLFHSVLGYQCKVVANLVFSHGVLGELLGDPKDPYKGFLKRLSNKGVKRLVEGDPGYHRIDVRGRDLLEFLPVLKHYEGDAGPYITTGIVSAVDPETKVVARGIHRLGLRGKNRLGVAFMNPPLRDVFPKYQQRGMPMPVSIAIGVDPITFLSMALKAPNDLDKMLYVSALKAGEAEAMKSFGSDIDIPFGPEYILEGYVDPEDREEDGPLGEISGYYLSFGKTPTVVVETIWQQESPIYHALLPTSLEGDTYLTFVSRAHLGDQVQRLFPFVIDIHLLPGTFGSSCVVCVREVERPMIGNLILFLLSFPMIKKVVVVDEDVDILDPYQVEWAVITRCKGDEDIWLPRNMKGQPIDPFAKEELGVTKIGINATVQGKKIDKRARVMAGDQGDRKSVV